MNIYECKGENIFMRWKTERPIQHGLAIFQLVTNIFSIARVQKHCLYKIGFWHPLQGSFVQRCITAGLQLVIVENHKTLLMERGPKRLVTDVSTFPINCVAFMIAWQSPCCRATITRPMPAPMWCVLACNSNNKWDKNAWWTAPKSTVYM